MIQLPIKRKRTHYPKDFLPSNSKHTQQSSFKFHQHCQISTDSTGKHHDNIKDSHIEGQTTFHSNNHSINPQKILLSSSEFQQDTPLNYHSSSKLPHIKTDLPKKPRFSISDKQEIEQKLYQTQKDAMSPNCIGKQLQNRQCPLPIEDPCKIEFIQSNTGRNSNISNGYIKYKSSSELEGTRWMSSDKNIIGCVKDNKSLKSQQIHQLLSASKIADRKSDIATLGAKNQYLTFRKNQQSLNRNYGKINGFLASRKKKDQILPNEVPKFQQSGVQKLKEEINILVKKRKGSEKRADCQSLESESQIRKQCTSAYHETTEDRTLPELIISYRSSLSYLKDVYTKAGSLGSYRLVIKIPKLFTQNLIFKQQERQQLYKRARSIFHELQIGCENLVIKKYTNCTMIIVRNICLIWYFEGKRYLGGWQSEYLDEGFKHGLGLEWEPKKYVYYGEFVRNYRHGLGVYKDKTGINEICYWKKGHKINPQCLSLSGHQANNQQQYEGQEDLDGSDGRQNHVYQYL